MLRPTQDGERYELTSPTAMPKAGGFLWNQKMMVQVTNRGYSIAQFMQPEPTKYSHAPTPEAKTFMQPEQNYYTHHPGRFVYIKDEESREMFSAPYEPVRAPLDGFVFSAGKSDISWTAEHLGIRVQMIFGIPTHDVAELWTIKVYNLSGRQRKISVYPYFTIGYMSWMNLEGEYREDLGGVVANSVTPYQKPEDWAKIKLLKDKTYLLCETIPDAWEANQCAFEGEGGLHSPTALSEPQLLNGAARYETPVASVQYRLNLESEEKREFRFLFGPALDDAEIVSMRDKYLSEEGFSQASKDYAAYIHRGRGCLHIETPDTDLDNFVNNWMARQVFYHGDVNRLTTDPQTRNYMQDNMGMAYIIPEVTKNAILRALSQQEPTGSMPDGIILVEGAELKYINQIPHTDHCVWLPITLDVYLAETADYALLQTPVKTDNGDNFTVFERLSRAMDWLLSEHARDKRGLSYISQGDWCDPMNMAGWKGKGVSGWLTVATAYALNLWAGICEQQGAEKLAVFYRKGAQNVNDAAKKYLWDGEWFARGITDDNVVFGVNKDPEGRIWLNPQAWSILGGAAGPDQIAKMLPQVDKQLSTPHGVLMFAPPFTGMREDIGRVSQKYPGQGENGSVYNHAGAFFVHSLYSIGESDRAFKILRQMIPGPNEEDYVQRGQLPIFIPNYYRGGHEKYPRTAGRSSQLFNTGTVSWVYRGFVEGLCGLRGDTEGLRIDPQLPSVWDYIKVTREFRGATFIVDVRRKKGIKSVRVEHEGKILPDAHFTGVESGKTYHLSVSLPLINGAQGKSEQHTNGSTMNGWNGTVER
ncbi:putative Six-hairpin glycosidase-like protein [Seiridium cardinale]|uniref:Six-hairpin glycosidase-like protein n=1 Tax=Seiridium cardinale TaxID=138064 RepID=A0ABR2Y3N6_9PEZI